jgi:hypothetical protein
LERRAGAGRAEVSSCLQTIGLETAIDGARADAKVARVNVIGRAHWHYLRGLSVKVRLERVFCYEGLRDFGSASRALVLFEIPKFRRLMFLKEVVKCADILFNLQVLEINLGLLGRLVVIVVHLLR